MVERLLTDPGIDLVLTLGILSSSQAAARRELPKPVFAPYIVDPVIQRVPFELRERELSPGEMQRVIASGVGNLSYLMMGGNLTRDVTVFRELAPFSRLVNRMPTIQARISHAGS